MRLIGMTAALFLAVAGATTEASASTITDTLNFVASGFQAQAGHKVPRDPVRGSVSFSFDNSKSYTDATAGLKLNSINLAVTGPVVFSYDPSQSWLIIGANGHANPYTWGTNDFSLSIFFQPDPSGGFFGYSQKGVKDSFQTYNIQLTEASTGAASVRALALPATPIPASLLMLATALAALGGVAMTRPRRETAA